MVPSFLILRALNILHVFEHLNVASESLLQFSFRFLVLEGETPHATRVLTLNRVENRQIQCLADVSLKPKPGVPIPNPHTQNTILNFLRAERQEI